MNPNTKTLIGAIIAAALAIAVYYGVIGQQQANTIQTQTNQTLGTGPAGQQAGTPAPQTSGDVQAPTATPAPAPQSTPPAPQQH